MEKKKPNTLTDLAPQVKLLHESIEPKTMTRRNAKATV